MNNRKQSTRVVLLAAAFGCAAFGQTRTWVSGTGDDANPCSRTFPCRTFTAALIRTAAGGEIDAIDAGAFGPVTITKSITIDGGSSIAGVLAGSGTTAILVNAGAGAVVTLRGLDINGGAIGSDGVSIVSAGVVRIEKSRIYSFTGNGVNVTPAAAPVAVSITDTTIHDCTGAASAAVNLDSTNGIVTAALGRVQAHGSTMALNAVNGSRASVRDFDFASNANGIAVMNGAVATLESGIIAFTNTAVQTAGSGAITRLSNMTITDNTTGLVPGGGGSIISFNNNRIRGNGTDGNPTTTYFLR
jgi:hypothetical protein